MKAREWKEVREELYTPEQIAESNRRVIVMSDSLQEKSQVSKSSIELSDSSREDENI